MRTVTLKLNVENAHWLRSDSIVEEVLYELIDKASVSTRDYLQIVEVKCGQSVATPIGRSYFGALPSYHEETT